MTTSPDYKQRDHVFANSIQVYRRKSKLTQSDLSKQVKVSIRTIKSWESGDSYPQPEHLRKLIEIFLENNCFNEGEELTEAMSLWSKATNGKTDENAAFDKVWFNTKLHNQPGPLRPVYVQGQPRQDWSEAVENRVLYGREQERDELEKWIIKDKQRIVGVFGMGGMGKTGLVVSVAHQLAPQFDYVIFRSVHNATPLGELLDSMLRFLLNGQLNNLPTVQSEKLALLMDYLRDNRCLIVLDNLETIMQDGLAAGDFRQNYTDYADLIRRISEFSHKSCLLITSREKPRQAAFREAKNGYVRSLGLQGLDIKSCQAILQSMNVTSDEEQCAKLIQHYSGNPLALKLIAEPIKNISGGNLGDFLASQIFNYGDGEIRFILDQHFVRLSPVEQEILNWLAISRESLDVEELQNRSLLQVGTQTFADGLSALFKRFLIQQNETGGKPGDKKYHGFTLQGVVAEYATRRLLNQLHAEIVSQKPEMIYRYPLFQTGVREHMRQNQLRVLVDPLLHQLRTTLKRDETVKRYLKQLLEDLRTLPQSHQGYAGGNLLNLLIRLGADMSGWNLSGLALWQTNLAGVELHDIDMRKADLTGAIFTEANISGYSLAYSPDGKILAIGCVNGVIKLWQTGETFGSQLRECLGHTNIVGALAFNSDGSILASGSVDGTIRLWEPNSGICLAVLDGRAKSIYSIAFSPDGKWLAGSGKEHSFYLWQVSNTQLVAKIDAAQGWLIMSVAFSPDGRLVATGGYDSTIKIWETAALLKSANQGAPVKVEPLEVLRGHHNWIRRIAFSPNGQFLASSSSDQTVRLWSLAGRTHYQHHKILTEHEGIPTDIVFSLDNRLLASGRLDGTINLYNLSNLTTPKNLPTGNGAVVALAFHPHGDTLVNSNAEASKLKIWSLINHEVQDVLPGYSDLIFSMMVSPNGQWLGATGVDNHLLLWNIGQSFQSRPVVFKGHKSIVLTLAFSPDGKNVASAGSDNIIKLWDLATGKCWRDLNGFDNLITTLAFSADSRLLLSGDEEGNLRLWSLITRECLYSLRAHDSRIRKVLFDPAGKILASCADDGTIHLWKVDTQNALITELHGWQSESHLEMSLVFNRDGTRLFSAGGDGIIRAWDVATGECAATFSVNKNMIWLLDYYANGEDEKLAAIGRDGIIEVWQLEKADKAVLLTCFEHGAKGTAVAFNAGGNLVFSAGQRGIIKVWDLAANRLATTLTARTPYDGLNIKGITGLTEAQRLNLLNLGAIESSS